MAARFPLAWGSTPLYATRLSTEQGRELTELTPAVGDGGSVLDSGPVVRRVSAVLEWAPLTGEDVAAALARRDAFLAQVSRNLSEIFSDPLHGEAFAARVGRVSTDNGPESTPVDNVEFVEDRGSDFRPRLPDAGVEPLAGAQEVRVQADRADAELAALGLSSPEPQLAADQADEWADRATDTDAVVDARRVERELESRTSALLTALGALGLIDRVGAARAYYSMTAVSSSLVRAAAAATSETTRTRTLLVPATTSLRALAASLDVANAQRLYEGIRALNRVDRPTAVPAGTTLLIPVLS